MTRLRAVTDSARLQQACMHTRFSWLHTVGRLALQGLMQG